MAVTLNSSGVTFPDATTQTTAPTMELISVWTANGSDTSFSFTPDFTTYSQHMLIVTDLACTQGAIPNSRNTVFGPYGLYWRTTGGYYTAATSDNILPNLGTFNSNNPWQSLSSSANFNIVFVPSRRPLIAGTNVNLVTSNGYGFTGGYQLRYNGGTYFPSSGGTIGCSAFNEVNSPMPFTRGVARWYGLR
jgi:hypothetical protein